MDYPNFWLELGYNTTAREDQKSLTSGWYDYFFSNKIRTAIKN